MGILAARKFYRSESAQATTEYVLMLAVALMLFTIIVRGFVQPWVKKLTAFLEGKIKDELFKTSGDAMHRFPFKR